MNIDDLLKDYVKNDIISFDSVLSLGKDKAMKQIIKEVHKYAITPPKTEDGRWSTYVVEKGKRRLIRKATEKDLEKFLLIFYDKEIRRCNLSFEDMFYEYIEYKKNFIKVKNKKKAISPTTIRRYERDFDKYLKDTPFVKMNMDNIKVKDIELFLLNLIKNNNMKEKCFKNILGYFGQVFEYATNNDYIERNIFLLVDKNLLLAHCEITVYTDEERVLNKDEIKLLVNSIHNHLNINPKYAPNYAILLALHTGMRVGELSALMWSDIRDGFIYIDRMERRLDFKDKKSELVIDEPKGLKHRRIPLTDELNSLFTTIKENIPSDDYIFKINGKRCTERSLSAACDRRSEEAGLSASIHMIRRTVSSELQKVASRQMVANLLGHNEETNKKHYTYDNSTTNEQIVAFSEMYSNVFNFETYKANKKEVETLAK